MLKTFRCTMFDLNHIRPNIEFTVEAETKTMAMEAARIRLHERGQKQHELMTNGMSVCTTVLTNSKGEKVTCTIREISPEYYNTLLDECWGFAEVKRVIHVNSGVSSEDAVASAEAAYEQSVKECEIDSLSDSPIVRRKKRWTKAQKRAAKVERDAAATAA